MRHRLGNVRIASPALAHLGAIALLTTLLCANSAHAHPAFFMGLGDAPGGASYSTAVGISGDGSMVVGRSGNESFRWTRQTGMMELSSPGGTTTAQFVSNDGSTIVGGFTPSGMATQTFRWQEATGIVLLPQTPSQIGEVVGVTANGSKVIFQLGAWTPATGYVGSPNGMRIADISGDGSTYTGWGGNNTQIDDGFIWTPGGQYGIHTETGPPLPDGTRFTDPFKFSADGQVVVGDSYNSSFTPTFIGAGRWDQAAGFQFLGFLPDGGYTSGHAGISGDGSVIVGYRSPRRVDPPLAESAWIWRESRGIEWIRDVLTNEYGLGSQIAGWRFYGAKAISNDGRTIVGDGVNPSGRQEVWIAYLGDPVPEPSTLLLAALALAPLARRNRRGGHCVGPTAPKHGAASVSVAFTAYTYR